MLRVYIYAHGSMYAPVYLNHQKSIYILYATQYIRTINHCHYYFFYNSVTIH